LKGGLEGRLTVVSYGTTPSAAWQLATAQIGDKHRPTRTRPPDPASLEGRARRPRTGALLGAAIAVATTTVIAVFRPSG
jgi:hypothetical protein